VADTAFVARLGAAPLAALGVATALLSSVFWVFNFLGVGTQTEVSRCVGSAQVERGRRAVGSALILAGVLGTALAAASYPWLGAAARWMGASGAMEGAAVTYLEIRLLGAPAMLAVLVEFGALRGLQDMRTPLWIAAVMSGLNVALDAILIFGAGPIPALGVAGAAWATTASQWLGAVWGWAVVRRRPGVSARLELREALALLVVGRDMVLRTGLLLFFMLLVTRAATRIGAEAGAAHQAVRQLWMLSALILDAYAASAQSLVAYFLGAGQRSLARRVARVACEWSLATGAVLAVALWALEVPFARLLVPSGAHALFASALWVLALAQPLNGLSFATDGIHWGTADYAYLRNAMIVATGVGAALLVTVDVGLPQALVHVWIVTAAWIAVRALFGVLRVWPGIGRAPLDPAVG
jgi:MATE family multidrug resistance protein